MGSRPQVWGIYGDTTGREHLRMRGGGSSRDGACAVPGGLDQICLISSSEQPANSVFLCPLYGCVPWVLLQAFLLKARQTDSQNSISGRPLWGREHLSDGARDP